MKALRRFGTTRFVTVGLLALTLLGICTFCISRHGWYDQLSVGEQVNFWTQALVAYGTLALAFVTVGSIMETQAVIAGENIRFQLSRMPSVRILEINREFDQMSAETTCCVTLDNHGDGLAQDVKLWLTVSMTIRWNVAGTSTEQDQAASDHFEAKEMLVASYLQAGRTAHVDVPVKDQTGKEQFTAVGYSSATDVTSARLEYRDMFGNKYASEYDVSDGFFSNDYKWVTPTSLSS